MVKDIVLFLKSLWTEAFRIPFIELPILIFKLICVILRHFLAYFIPYSTVQIGPYKVKFAKKCAKEIEDELSSAITFAKLMGHKVVFNKRMHVYPNFIRIIIVSKNENLLALEIRCKFFSNKIDFAWI